MINLPVDEIKTRLAILSKNLVDALEGNDHEQALGAQQEFTKTIAIFWKTTEQSEIDPKTKAIVRVAVGWAVNELPELINDPANNAEIKRQVKLFQSSLKAFSPAE